jgi:hypothetical protein
MIIINTKCYHSLHSTTEQHISNLFYCNVYKQRFLPSNKLIIHLHLRRTKEKPKIEKLDI